MQYNFLKEEIEKKAKEGALDTSLFSKLQLSKEDGFVFETNLSVLQDIFNFFISENKIFILNGFMGSGKSLLLNSCADFLRNEILVFRINHFTATNLDDILLSIFMDFSTYHNQRKIVLPKVDSTIFSEKIHAFIKALNVPMVFILDSFDIHNISQKEQKDVLDFITYLSNFDKVKVIVGSRSFDEDYLPSQEGVSSSTVKLLDREGFNKLLLLNNINENVFHVEEAFKNTKGHYLYASMLVNLVSLLHITFANFLGEYSKKNVPFNEFLVFKMLGLIPDRFLKLLCLLTLIRHGVSEQFVLMQRFATKEDLEYLKTRMIIAWESDYIYLKDYMKAELEKSLAAETKIKVHEYFSDLYEAQLPKKPAERDLVISRATMRAEMSYHDSVLKELVKDSKNAKVQPSDNVDFTYLSYSKTVGYDKVSGPLKSAQKPIQKQGSINEKQKRFELSKEELVLLNSSNSENENVQTEYLSSFQEEAPEKRATTNAVNGEVEKRFIHKENLEDWISIAQSAEEQFDFNSAILSYLKALEQKEEPLFEVKKPLIMTKLAICYKKNQNIEKALKQFEEVYKIYQKSESVKANYILLSIAQIYNETYKFSLAKSTYLKILSSGAENPPALLVRVLLDLAEIEDNNSNLKEALEYCQKALIEAEKIDDLKLVSESYFKYALFMDDAGKVDVAFKYYQKCVQVSEDPQVNNYLSSAYSNLASILSEQNDIKKAVKYYELAIEVDKIQNNYEGLYFGYSKLAHIFQSESPQKAIEYLVKALGAARRLDDCFYAASVYLDLGDFYYNRKVDIKALKAYLSAKKLILKQPNEENLQKVNTRINDLKVRLGDAKFIKLMSEFKKSK